MKRVEECTAMLVDAIQNSEEYQRFLKIKEEVAKDPELREQINAFRRHNFQVQNSQEVLDVYEEIDKMSVDYQEFRKNPLVDEFLKSELSVCRIIQRVTMEITRSVDLDTKDFADGFPF
jgi:cell fate (sporulation/competence/biofilm development) regulator YlbF (YheA/YmcA/DUF963 family)